MIYLDTNVVLRYLLEDHAEFFPRSVELIENNDVYIKNEVLAEIVYVLHKTYSVSKQDLNTVLIGFLNMDNVYLDSKQVACLAVKIFSERNIDFVDALLCALQKQENITVVTFDKRLNNCLSSSI
jgi:predicted nucleic-acid-binding protein